MMNKINRKGGVFMGYSYGGNCNNYCGGGNDGYRGGSSFALIVVLFILLIIIGATFIKKDC